MEQVENISIEPSRLIEFVNLVNECCMVMDHTHVEDWLLLPHGFLDKKSPLEEFNKNGTDKIFQLLHLIEIDEADLVD